MKVKHTADYRKLRAKEYPTVGDQLDALWKLLQVLDVEIPDESQDVINAINSVKSKYPKSTKERNT